MNLHRLGHDGVFSVAAATAAGLDGTQLRRRARQGQCHRLIRGWYAVGPEGDPLREHVLRATALKRHLPGVCVSHYSLVVTLGLPVVRSELDVVHLTRLADQSSRHRPGAVIHPCVDGVVSLAQAIVQTGLVSGASEALVTGDAALHRRLVTRTDLDAAVHRFAGHPFIADVRRTLAGVDGRSESPGETLLRMVLVDAGLPVTPQLVIPDGPVRWRADFVVDGTTVLVEFDGMAKYAGSSDLAAEKYREDRLRDLGYEVVRVTWADLAHPDRIVARIRQAMLRARRAA